MRCAFTGIKMNAQLQILIFTRALIGFALSPFLFRRVIKVHLSSWKEREPELVAKIRWGLYVNDLIMGSTSVCKAQELKNNATTLSRYIFQNACFNFHKWHSNVRELELAQTPVEDPTYAKQQLGIPQVEVSRPLAVHREALKCIELHSFRDASTNGVAACIYALFQQASGTNQGLVATRSRLSRRGLTIP